MFFPGYPTIANFDGLGAKPDSDSDQSKKANPDSNSQDRRTTDQLDELASGPNNATYASAALELGYQRP